MPSPPPIIRKGPDNVKKWMIEESIWAPRKGWADSGNYHDTKEHMRKCFEVAGARELNPRSQSSATASPWTNAEHRNRPSERAAVPFSWGLTQ